MKLKSQDYCITISFKPKGNPTIYPLETSFIIKAADVNEEQALKIANILFPDFFNIKVVSIKNDDLTLTYEDYENLHMMVNDRLLCSIKEKKFHMIN